MQALKSTILKKRKCEFGDFELVSERGWKISQSFVDYESGLLVVSTSDEDESHWEDTGFGSRTIPTKEYIINPDTGDILSREQWSKQFSYAPKEVISEDGKYKLVTTRVHNKKRDSDSITEELYEIETNKLISSGKGIAFSEKKRETSLERLYREKEEREKRKAELEAIPTLQEFYENELKNLKEGNEILNFFNTEWIYKLSYNGSEFELKRVQEKYNYNLDWSSLDYQVFEVFNSIEDFSIAYLNKKEWYFNHNPFKRNNSKAPVNQLLKKFVVEFFNELREKHEFTFGEYNKLNAWENIYYKRGCVKPKEYKQYCSNCKKSVLYDARYPKHICNECSSKLITDEYGVELSFSNIGMTGGLSISYKKDGEIIKKDTSQYQKLCYIDGKRFIATEARMGGIVIQTEK